MAKQGHHVFLAAHGHDPLVRPKPLVGRHDPMCVVLYILCLVVELRASWAAAPWMGGALVPLEPELVSVEALERPAAARDIAPMDHTSGIQVLERLALVRALLVEPQ